MNHPLISVLMTVYNTELYVKAALQSVLAQTYPNIEIIIVDDGSTDTSREILQTFADRATLIFLEKNSGIAAARNAALQHAHGDFIALMDSDDLWHPEKLSIQYAAFSKNPDISICFCHMECFISPELPEEIKALRHCPQGILPVQLPPAAMIKKEAFDRVGLFDPAYRVGEFIDWMARATEANLVTHVVPENLLSRRIHNTNTGVRARNARVDYLKLLKASLDRKRSASV